MAIKAFLCALMAAISVNLFASAQPSPTRYAADRVSFTVTFGPVTSNLAIITTSIMPGATLRIEMPADIEITGGTLKQDEDGWFWTAPQSSGLQTLTFTKGSDTSTLNIFVLTPFANGVQSALNGYKIGRYSQPYKGLASYAIPEGFIDLSDGPTDLKVSPNFTLGQFICKQQPGHDPTYLMIHPATLIKLEALLQSSRTRGWEADTLHIMSGYRTPFYNAAIGNKTTSSRHLYGDAADIWIDTDGDGQMDDLNGDGKIDKADAREFAKWAEELAKTGGANWPTRGGIGIYKANAYHGPFIHIDSRGYKARW